MPENVEPHYYSATVRKADHMVMLPPQGPFTTWTAVMAYHGGVLAHQPPRLSTTAEKYDHRVLLDLSTAGWIHDRHEVSQLLHHDPLLRAVFELGRSAGENGRHLRDVTNWPYADEEQVQLDPEYVELLKTRLTEGQ